MSEESLRSEIADLEREMEILEGYMSDMKYNFSKKNSSSSLGRMFFEVTGVSHFEDNKYKKHEEKMGKMNSELLELGRKRDRKKRELDDLIWQKN